MTKYYEYDEEGFIAETYYLGTADEVETEYNKLVKEYPYKPVFTEAPKFNSYKSYALCVDKDAWVSIINAEHFARLFFHGYIERASD